MRKLIPLALSFAFATVANAASYRLTQPVAGTVKASNQAVVREADGASIPADPRNADFQVFTAWLNAGNTPDAALAAPTVVSTLTFLQFMALFTPTEQAAIVNSTDTQARLFTIMAAGSGGIQLSNPQVIGGINYLVSISILTSPRAAAVLAGTPLQ